MRDILLEEGLVESWTARAQKIVRQEPAEHSFLRDGEFVVDKGTDQITSQGSPEAPTCCCRERSAPELVS